METAALRIKFTPLLKKISSGNSNSKCCIEIIPELSGYQNLNKINWKLDEKFVEYKIPMTYKILIKKQDAMNTTKTEAKIYHSCVDLMQGCSITNSDLASGDVTRIISDNFFLKSIASRIDKCDFVVTKDLLSPEVIETIISRKKTASIQTLDCCEPCYSSLSSQRPLADKSQETGITCKPTLVTVAVNCDETVDKIPVEQNKQNKILVNDDSSGFNEALEVFKNNLHNKLSLSPICSISTYDVLPSRKVYTKSNTSSFILCDSFSKTNLQSEDYDSNAFNDNELSKEVSDVPFSKSHQIFKFLTSQTNVTLKNIHDKDTVERKLHFIEQPKEMSIKDIAMSITNLTMTPSFELRNYDNHFKKYDKHNIVIEQQYKYTVPNIRKAISKTHKDEYEDYNRKMDSRRALIIDKRNMPCPRTIPTENNKVVIFDEGFKHKRVLPSIRVAIFLKNLEKEILPLKVMLKEIKVKCMSLGLFPCDLKQRKKSIMYKPLPFPNLNTQIKDIDKAHKSNRVVYTILFNG